LTQRNENSTFLNSDAVLFHTVGPYYVLRDYEYTFMLTTMYNICLLKNWLFIKHTGKTR